MVPVFNLTKYSDNYSEISGGLWQDCRDEPALDDIGAIVGFTNNTTDI